MLEIESKVREILSWIGAFLMMIIFIGSFVVMAKLVFNTVLFFLDLV